MTKYSKIRQFIFVIIAHFSEINTLGIPKYATKLHLDISTPNYIEHTTSGGHGKRGLGRTGFIIGEFFDVTLD